MQASRLRVLQFGIFWTVGEICSATSRLLIEHSVASKFFALLKERTEQIRVGNPLDKDTRLGPLVNESQYHKVLQYIEVCFFAQIELFIAQMHSTSVRHSPDKQYIMLLSTLNLIMESGSWSVVCSRIDAMW